MGDVDQRGFSNPPSNHMSAREAAAYLGIKLETLYAYASRGWVASVRGERGRPRKYLREDLDRLRVRRDARAGHAAVAGGALRWGEPVLESSLTAISEDGPSYRGHLAVKLARDDVPFERVAELLWSDEMRVDAVEWPVRNLGVSPGKISHLLAPEPQPLAAMTLLLAAVANRDPGRFALDPVAVTTRARTIIVRMAASVSLVHDIARVESALEERSIAGVLSRALRPKRNRDTVSAINRALVLCADHELNVSAFAARVAASAGSDLYGCLLAALATLAGPKHGGVCDRVEAMVAEVGRAGRATTVLRERIRRGDEIPGFGHRLYPKGDPRAIPMLEMARAIGASKPRAKTLLEIVSAARELGLGEPSLDSALVGLSFALDLPAGSAITLFGIGRSAGWVAHVLEQYQAGFLLRPRAKYVGR